MCMPHTASVLPLCLSCHPPKLCHRRVQALWAWVQPPPCTLLMTRCASASVRCQHTCLLSSQPVPLKIPPQSVSSWAELSDTLEAYPTGLFWSPPQPFPCTVVPSPPESLSESAGAQRETALPTPALRIKGHHLTWLPTLCAGVSLPSDPVGDR